MGERYLGTIVATTTTTNSSTATPFTINNGARLSIQPDAACYVAVSASSSVTATTTNGVKVEANALFPTSVPPTGSAGYVAVLAVSGTVNAKVFEREGNE